MIQFFEIPTTFKVFRNYIYHYLLIDSYSKSCMEFRHEILQLHRFRSQRSSSKLCDAIPEQDEMVTKVNSVIYETNSGCGTGSQMVNIMEQNDMAALRKGLYNHLTLTVINHKGVKADPGSLDHNRSWQILQILMDSRGSWQILMDSRGSWQILMDSRGSWQILMDSRGSWQILMNSRGSWQILMDSNGSSRILVDPNGF